MAMDKGLVRWTIGIVGAILAIVGFASIYYGLEAYEWEDLIVLGYEKEVCYAMVWSGAVLILTAGFGWTAAYSKNHCMAFCFGYMSMVVMLVYVSMGAALLVLKNNMN